MRCKCFYISFNFSFYMLLCMSATLLRTLGIGYVIHYFILHSARTLQFQCLWIWNILFSVTYFYYMHVHMYGLSSFPCIGREAARNVLVTFSFPHFRFYKLFHFIIFQCNYILHKHIASVSMARWIPTGRGVEMWG